MMRPQTTTQGAKPCVSSFTNVILTTSFWRLYGALILNVFLTRLVCLKPNDTFKFESNFLQIWEILEMLNELEASIPFCSPNERGQDHFERLLEHLKAHGKHETLVKQDFTIEKLPNEAYFGVKAKKEFKVSFASTRNVFTCDACS